MYDNKKFDEISKRYEAAVRSHRNAVELATAKVEISKAVISEINKQLQAIAGPISYEIQQERNRLYQLRREQTDKLKQREDELAAALCGGQDKMDETMAAMAETLKIQ